VTVGGEWMIQSD